MHNVASYVSYSSAGSTLVLAVIEVHCIIEAIRALCQLDVAIYDSEP